MDDKILALRNQIEQPLAAFLRRQHVMFAGNARPGHVEIALHHPLQSQPERNDSVALGQLNVRFNILLGHDNVEAVLSACQAKFRSLGQGYEIIVSRGT